MVGGVAFRSVSNKATESRQGGGREQSSAEQKGPQRAQQARSSEWLQERTVGLGTQSRKGDKTRGATGLADEDSGFYSGSWEATRGETWSRICSAGLIVARTYVKVEGTEFADTWNVGMEKGVTFPPRVLAYG